MRKKVITVGILGTGEWTQKAHLPAFRHCRYAKVVALCGHDSNHNREVSSRFGIPETYTDHHELLERADIDMIVVSTASNRHFALALDAVRAGKAVLCEKPLATNYEEARTLSKEAATRGVRTKVAYTFRYSPVIRRMKELVQQGCIGEPYHFNGFLQNSNFINAMTPYPLVPPEDLGRIMPGSLQEYAPHLIDLALWFVGDLKAVIGHMKNFIPQRMIRERGKIMRINFDDSCIWVGQFENGAVATFQTSMIAIGGRPGLELRVFGSKGALIGRLVEQLHGGGTLTAAKRDQVSFVPVNIPRRLCPPWYGKQTQKRGWSSVDNFRNLVEHFADEIINDQEPEDNFLSGAKTQEVTAAVYLSHLEKRWVSLPLDQ